MVSIRSHRFLIVTTVFFQIHWNQCECCHLFINQLQAVIFGKVTHTSPPPSSPSNFNWSQNRNPPQENTWTLHTQNDQKVCVLGASQVRYLVKREGRCWMNFQSPWEGPKKEILEVTIYTQIGYILLLFVLKQFRRIVASHASHWSSLSLLNLIIENFYTQLYGRCVVDLLTSSFIREQM